MMNVSGFVDLQVNGYAGLDCNADGVTSEELRHFVDRLRDDGVDQILVTIITAPLPSMLRRIKNWARLLNDDPDARDLIGGIHIEGPFISPEDGFVGAHPVDAVCSASVDLADQLVDAGDGLVKLVTLAPEQDAGGVVTKWLVERGIVVAAGHSDATLAQLNESMDSGLSLFTHLGNGCPARLHRHDNIVQRVLSVADQISVSFIADGHHVPFFALKNYLQCVPLENIVIVTDAIAAAGMGPGDYQLGNQTVHVDSQGAAWSADRTHFAGSAATMPGMAVALSKELGVSDSDLKHWMVENPWRLLGATSEP